LIINTELVASCWFSLFTLYTARMFKKRVLRKTFRVQRTQIIREWRKLHNEQLHDLYS